MNLKNIPSFFTADDVVAEFGGTTEDALDQIKVWIKNEQVEEIGGGFYQVL